MLGACSHTYPGAIIPVGSSRGVDVVSLFWFGYGASWGIIVKHFLTAEFEDASAIAAGGREANMQRASEVDRNDSGASNTIVLCSHSRFAVAVRQQRPTSEQLHFGSG
jgi:hypothetical protein